MDSNQRHSGYEPLTLPTELYSQTDTEGFEPSRLFKVCIISNDVRSATLPRIQKSDNNGTLVFNG